MGFVQLHFPETCFLSPSEQGEEDGEEVLERKDAIEPYCSTEDAAGVTVQMVQMYTRQHSPALRTLKNQALMTKGA